MAPRFKTAETADWLWLPLLVLVLLLFFALRRVREDNRAIVAEAESLQQQIFAVQLELEAANKSAMPTSATPTPNTAVPASASQSKAPKSAGLAWYSDRNAIADPDVGAPVVRRHRRYAMANYRAAIDALELAPAAKERLKQLIIERWNAREDVSDILQRQAGTSPELREKMVAEMIANVDQEIRALLGEDGFAALEYVHKEQSTKSMNWGLFTSAWDVGAPLRDDQQTLVARAMLQVKELFPTPEAANEVDPASGLSRADLALLELSASFLSPEQVAAIRADKIGTGEYRQAVREAQQRKQSETGRRAPP